MYVITTIGCLLLADLTLRTNHRTDGPWNAKKVNQKVHAMTVHGASLSQQKKVV